MDPKRDAKVWAFAVVIIGAFAAACVPSLPADPAKLEARSQPAPSNSERDVALQEAVRVWRNELTRVVDDLNRDAWLRAADDDDAARLRARARELEATRGQLASRARYLGIGAANGRADAFETERLAFFLIASIDRVPEASGEVARSTLDRVEAVAPHVVRTALGTGGEGVRVASRGDVVITTTTAAP